MCILCVAITHLSPWCPLNWLNLLVTAQRLVSVVRTVSLAIESEVMHFLT
jgi:hypothetical protein